MTMGLFDIFNEWRKSELSAGLRKGSSPRRKKKKSDSDPEKARIIRKLKHRMKYLELEHEDIREKLKSAKDHFFSAIQRYCQENPSAKNPLVPKEQKKEAKQEKASFGDELKNIYREIVKATHPDLQQENDEELTEALISAANAKQENEIDKLINISFDLDIDISNISIELIEDIEKSLEEKQAKINKMRKDVAIVWHYGTEEQKKALIVQICPLEKD
jgi:hypothetical protein